MEVADLFATLGLKVNDKQWERGSEMIHGMHHALEFFVTFEAVKFLGEMVETVTKTAIEAERLSQKLGISTKDVQELGYAARVSGVDAGELQVGMQKLAKGLDEARTKGSGPVAETFARLGISMQDPAVKSLDLGDTIELLAEKFKKMPDNAKKTALAIDLFGRSGTALIPMLNQGKDGIAEFRQEAEDLGIVITQDDAKAFEKFEEDQIRLKATLEGLRNTVVKALLPVLQDMVKGLLEWTKANKELLASTLKSVLEALIVVVKGLGYAFEFVSEVIDFFKDHTDLATAIIIALGVVIAAFAIEAAVAWLLAFWPLVLVVAAIAAVVLVVMDLWRSITTGKGVAATVFRWIARQAQTFWEGLKAIATGIKDFFVSVGTGIKDAFTAAFDWAVEKARAALDTIRHLPGFEQVLDLAQLAGTGAGHVARAITGDEAAGGSGYEQAVAAGQFSGSEADWKNQTMGRGVATGGTTAAPATSNTTVNVTAPVTINAPGADAKSVQDQIEQHHEQVVREVWAGTGGADVNNLSLDAANIPGGQ